MLYPAELRRPVGNTDMIPLGGGPVKKSKDLRKSRNRRLTAKQKYVKLILVNAGLQKNNGGLSHDQKVDLQCLRLRS